MITGPPLFCVFCGHNDYIVIRSGSFVWIKCNCCLAEGPKEPGTEEAVASWNFRTDKPAHSEK